MLLTTMMPIDAMPAIARPMPTSGPQGNEDGAPDGLAELTRESDIGCAAGFVTARCKSAPPVNSE